MAKPLRVYLDANVLLSYVNDEHERADIVHLEFPPVAGHFHKERV